MTSTAVVVGVGLSSRATADEVRRLVARTVAQHGFTLDDITAIATRRCFLHDARLALGVPVVGHPDDALVAASAPCDRAVGIPALVAETAALLSARRRGEAQLLGPTERSPHATASIAVALSPDDALPHGGRRP